MQIEDCDDWGSNLKIRGVQAPVCKPLLSVGEYTTMVGVTVFYGDKGFCVPQRFECCKEDGCLGPEGVERFSIPRLYSCVQRKQRVQHLRETKRK